MIKKINVFPKLKYFKGAKMNGENCIPADEYATKYAQKQTFQTHMVQIPIQMLGVY